MSDEKRHTVNGHEGPNGTVPELPELSEELVEVVEVDASLVEAVEVAGQETDAPGEEISGAAGNISDSLQPEPHDDNGSGYTAIIDDEPSAPDAPIVVAGLPDSGISGLSEAEPVAGGKEDRPAPVYEELPADLEWPGGEPVIDSTATMPPGSGPNEAEDAAQHHDEIADGAMGGDIEIPGLADLSISTASPVETSEREEPQSVDDASSLPAQEPDMAELIVIDDEPPAAAGQHGAGEIAMPDAAAAEPTEEDGAATDAALTHFEPFSLDEPVSAADENGNDYTTLSAGLADDFSGSSHALDTHGEDAPAFQPIAPEPVPEPAPEPELQGSFGVEAPPASDAPAEANADPRPDAGPTAGAMPDSASTAPPAPETDPEPEPEPKQETHALDDSAWAIVRKRKFGPIVLDWGDKKYLMTRQGLKTIKSLNEFNKFFTYFVDFQESVAVGVTNLHSELKYANVMLRKHLEEQGEMVRDDMVHIYAKTRKGKTESNLFYQVFPRHRYNALLQNYEAYDPGFVIQDSFGFLYGMLQSLGKKRPHVLAMRMPEAILVLAGRGKTVVAARRIMMLGDDENSLTEGLFALQREVEPLKNALGEEIEHIEWIEPLTRSLKWNPHPAWKTPVKLWPMVEVDSDEGVFYSSLPTIVDRLDFTTSIGPKEERFLRPLEVMEKWVWVFLLLLLAGVAGTSLYLNQLITDEETQNLRLAQGIKDVRARMPKLPHYQAKDLKPILAMADTINLAAYAPTPTRVWNQLARTKPKAVRIDAVGVRYRLEATDITLRGEVELGLAHAQRVYSEYLEALQRAGYKLVSQSIRLDIQGNEFNVSLELPVQKDGRN